MHDDKNTDKGRARESVVEIFILVISGCIIFALYSVIIGVVLIGADCILGTHTYSKEIAAFIGACMTFEPLSYMISETKKKKWR